MSFLFSLGLGTGIACGIWGYISSFPSLGLITWVGFAGCTAYFACGKHGMEGFITAICTTLSGMVSALVAMVISGFIPQSIAFSALMTGVISATMCWQSKAKWLWFIPGAFIGCFTTFGVSSSVNLFSADILRVIISFLCGAVLAVCCDKGGGLIYKYFGKQE